MIMKKMDTVIEPGFGMMDGEFTHFVSKVNYVTRTFDVAAGILSGPRKMNHYRWDNERDRWVHRDLPIDVIE